MLVHSSIQLQSPHTPHSAFNSRESRLDPHDSLCVQLQNAPSVADLGYNSQHILYQASHRVSNNKLRAPTPEEVDLLEKVIHQSLSPDLIPVNGTKYTLRNLELTTYEGEFIPPLNQTGVFRSFSHQWEPIKSVNYVNTFMKPRRKVQHSHS